MIMLIALAAEITLVIAFSKVSCYGVHPRFNMLAA